MKLKTKEKNKGFVLLLAVIISSMILAIALSVSNITIKQMKFSTSAKEANKAFFAADIGIECALYFDSFTPSAYGEITPFLNTKCAENAVNVTAFDVTWNFALVALGTDGKSCTNVSFTRFNTPPFVRIISRGYNINGDNTNTSCIAGAMSLERELNVNY
jgi:hypothetical protein